MVKMQSTINMRWVVYFIASLILFSCKEPRKELTIVKEEITAYPDWITTDYVMGKFDPTSDESFEVISEDLADRKGLYLRSDVYEAYKKMKRQADEDGIRLVIRSATRNFDYQKGIWERKWTGETKLSDRSRASDITDEKERALKILRYSSMPGSSRHHWGTDIDLNSFDNSYFEYGEGLKVYDWLKQHASSFGFCQPYTSKSDGRSGYEEEKWHWTYTPISSELTRFSKKYLSNTLISGFQGSQAAVDIDIVGKYVLGISKDCL